VKYNRGQYAAAQKAGESLLELGRSLGNSDQILEGHHALWALLSVMGNPEDAVQHMQQSIALYDRQLHASEAYLYAGHDPGVCCRYHLAKDLWLLGHPDRSMAALIDALHLADQLKHPITLSTLHIGAAASNCVADRLRRQRQIWAILHLAVYVSFRTTPVQRSRATEALCQVP
jgi:tetratricopeptide (TPR) repeat protein